VTDPISCYAGYNQEFFHALEFSASAAALRSRKIALGAGMFGKTWGYGAEPDEVRSILQGYAAAGGNFIDTANNYQHGESERLVGEFLAPNRNDFVIASEFSRGASANPALVVLGANRKVMLRSVEDSLKRLKTDRIDLYFVHMGDGVTPMDEIARGLDDLSRSGKIVCGRPVQLAGLARRYRRGHRRSARLDSNRRRPDRIKPAAAHNRARVLLITDGLRLGIMGWSPLAAGLLTGKYPKGRERTRHQFEEQRAPPHSRKECVRDRHAYRYRRRDRVESRPGRHRLGALRVFFRSLDPERVLSSRAI
jgi:aryl-alcohol dehydrogenase-like predicted oxidoreductase